MRLDLSTRLGVTLMTALLLLSVWTLVDFAQAQTAPALVSIDRFDAVYGPQHVECWLTHFQYTGAVMLIDCHSDIDAIFGNGFEALSEVAP